MTESNSEGVMPAWPIPDEWKNAEAISRLNVVLYGQKISPPCSKIISILTHFGVKYTTVPSTKKESKYKKIPVLDIDGKQINDSEIIAIILAKVLDVDYDGRELEMERLNTRGLMLALEVVVMESNAELQKCGCQLGGFQGCLLWAAPCIITCCIRPSMKMKEKTPGLESVSSYAKQFAGFLGSKPYLHGDTLGVIDCSVFGVLDPFRLSKSAAFTDFILADERMAAWHKRMMSEMVTLAPSTPVV